KAPVPAPSEAPARIVAAARPGEDRQTALGAEHPVLLDPSAEAERSDAPGPVPCPVDQDLLDAVGRSPVQGQRPAIGVVRMAQSTAIGKLPRHEPAARIVGKGLAMPTAQQSVFDRKQPPGCIVFGLARLHWMVDAQRLLATPENPARDPFVAPRLDDLQRPARRIATERPVSTVLPGNAGESVEAIVLVGDDADAGILAAHQATQVVV